MKGFGASAMTAVSLSNYLVLILGYVGFSSLIKSRYGKLVFALIWFFPFQRFIDLTRYTIGVEAADDVVAIEPGGDIDCAQGIARR